MTIDYMEAENAVIGSILIDPRCLPEVQERLTVEDFGSEANKAIYRAALLLDMRGEVIDPVIIRNETEQMGCAVPTGYLVNLMDATPTAANVREYAELTRENSLRRSVLELTRSIYDEALRGGNPHEMIASLIERGNALEQQGNRKMILSPMEMILKWYEHRERIDSGTSDYKISTGIRALDRVLGDGYGRGGHHIIAARPGNGKTTLALNIAENVAKMYGTVLYITIEMSEVEIMSKRVAREAGINGQIVLSKKMTDEQYARHVKATDELLKRPLYVNKIPEVTVEDISMMARKMKDLVLLVVDYIGIVTPEKHLVKEQKHNQIGDISRRLKNLARKMDIPIITLCQINREVEKRAEKKPNLGDLRDSGNIEQDADSVTFLWHKEYFGNMRDMDDTTPREVEVSVQKNRMGATGECKLAFFPAFSKFISATSDPRQEYRENIQLGNI